MDESIDNIIDKGVVLGLKKLVPPRRHALAGVLAGGMRVVAKLMRGGVHCRTTGPRGAAVVEASEPMELNGMNKDKITGILLIILGLFFLIWALLRFRAIKRIHMHPQKDMAYR